MEKIAQERDRQLALTGFASSTGAALGPSSTGEATVVELDIDDIETMAQLRLFRRQHPELPEALRTIMFALAGKADLDTDGTHESVAPALSGHIGDADETSFHGISRRHPEVQKVARATQIPGGHASHSMLAKGPHRDSQSIASSGRHGTMSG